MKNSDAVLPFNYFIRLRTNYYKRPRDKFWEYLDFVIYMFYLYIGKQFKAATSKQKLITIANRFSLQKKQLISDGSFRWEIFFSRIYQKFSVNSQQKYSVRNILLGICRDFFLMNSRRIYSLFHKLNNFLTDLKQFLYVFFQKSTMDFVHIENLQGNPLFSCNVWVLFLYTQGSFSFGIPLMLWNIYIHLTIFFCKLLLASWSNPRFQWGV